MPYSNKTIRQEYEKTRTKYHRQYWQQNKDRYKNRWIERLGNPDQDKKILQFIRDKREGNQVPKYKQLPIFVFKYNNHAQCPRHYSEITSGEIEWNH